MILAQQASSGSPISLLILLALPVALFLMMRSQRKKVAQQQAVQRSAEIGDEIMTTSGMFGTIVEEDEEDGTVVVEIAPGTRVTMIRAAISRVVADDVSDEADEVDDEDDDVVELSDADEASHEPDAAEGQSRS